MRGFSKHPAKNVSAIGAFCDVVSILPIVRFKFMLHSNPTLLLSDMISCTYLE